MGGPVGVPTERPRARLGGLWQTYGLAWRDLEPRRKIRGGPDPGQEVAAPMGITDWPSSILSALVGVGASG